VTVLQVVTVVLVGLAGTAVVFTRDPRRLVLVNGAFGLALTLLFVVLQAPDVALSMLVVGAVAYPFVLLVALAALHGKDRE
jgi:energy-converting hydrogenase B subunit D